MRVKRQRGEVLEFHLSDTVEGKWERLKASVVVEAQALARVTGAKFFQILSNRGRILHEAKVKKLAIESSKQVMRNASGSRVVELVEDDLEPVRRSSRMDEASGHSAW